MKFSQRIGKRPVKESLQIEAMDEDLRNGLWNILYIVHFRKIYGSIVHKLDQSNKKIIYETQRKFFKRPLDELDDWGSHFVSSIKKWFFSSDWYEVFDYIEFVTQIDIREGLSGVESAFNNVLKQEVSGYRLIDGQVAQITAEEEIAEIQEALDTSRRTGLSGVDEHISAALAKLSDRKSPDYRNSIKESISAVESIAKIISGDAKVEFGKALSIIENRFGLHPALKRGFSAIYGYTSDEGGIRHAMLDRDDIDYEDAKYMLVACSAFINYLVAKIVKAKRA